MNRPEVYKRSVDVLFDAYFTGKLEHNKPCACGIGNLCGGWEDWANIFATSAQEGVKARGYLRPDSMWNKVYRQGENEMVQIICKEIDNNILAVAKAYTGYNLPELMDIEWAFESADEGENEEDYMFNGLAAVLDVLKKIHEIADEDLIQSNYKKFKDHYQKEKSFS